MISNKNKGKKFLFSLVLSLFITFLLFFVFYFMIIFFSYKELSKTNEETIKRINCNREDICDPRKIEKSWSFNPANYIIIKNNLFFIKNASEADGIPIDFYMNYSDVNFLKQFIKPKIWLSPTLEQWRLLTVLKQIQDKKIYINVGWIDNSTWLLEPTKSSTKTNVKLLKEINHNILPHIVVNKGKIIIKGEVVTNVDMYQIVDGTTNKVIHWSNGIPAFFPKNKKIDNKFFLLTNSEIFIL